MHVVFTGQRVVVHVHGVGHAGVFFFHCFALGHGLHVGVVEFLGFLGMGVVMPPLFRMSVLLGDVMGLFDMGLQVVGELLDGGGGRGWVGVVVGETGGEERGEEEEEAGVGGDHCRETD